MNARVILVPCGDKFRRVAGKEKVLQIDVCQNDLLVAALESVEAAVGVLFQELEVGGVVFDAVTVRAAEDAQAGLLVDKEEPAEISVELLNAGSGGDEIVVVAEIVQLHFHKGFLEAEMVVKAVGAVTHVRADDAKLANVEIVETDLGGDADAPIDRLERRVAVEKIEAETQSLIEEGLFPASKKTRTAGLHSTHAAGRRNSAAIEEGFRRSGDVQENLLAKNCRPDGLIAF